MGIRKHFYDIFATENEQATNRLPKALGRKILDCMLSLFQLKMHTS